MNRPKTLTCYLCGQGFGTASLAIHQPQCYRKKLAQWEVGDLRMRGPRPVDPTSRCVPTKGHKKMTSADIDRFNEEQFQGYVEALSPCPNCGRRFNPQSLQVHLRSCRPGNTAKPVNYTDNSPRQGASRIHGGRGVPEYCDSDVELSGLIPCRKCGRRFVADRIAIHEHACLRMKARKKFSSHQQRARGTEIDSVRHSAHPVKKPSVWRQQHQDFVKAIRYAKMVTTAQAGGRSLASLPPPPPSVNPDYIQCPHCQRRYNPAVAERHIPACANIVNKPKPPPGAQRLSPTPMSRASPSRSPMRSPMTLSPAPQRRSPSPMQSSPMLANTQRTHHSPATSLTRQQPTASPMRISRKTAQSVPTRRNRSSDPHAIQILSPKQCHNCGFDYPQSTAKFCAECGAKRV